MSKIGGERDTEKEKKRWVYKDTYTYTYTFEVLKFHMTIMKRMIEF